MICNTMSMLTKVDLVAFIDGEASEVAQAHIATCAHCQAEVQALVLWQQQVKEALHRLHCPAIHTLGEYQLGILAHEEAAAIQRHLQSCPHCQSEVERLQTYLTAE